MAKVTRLRETVDGDERACADPLRNALAAAIEAAGKSRAVLEKRRAAARRLSSEAAETEERIEALTKAVTMAEAAHLDAIAEAAASGAPVPASGVPKAREAVVVAQDHVDTLRAARRKVEANMPDWEADVAAADAEVERLISAILAPHVAKLVAEAQEAARRLAPYQALLLALVQDHRDWPTEWALQRAFDEGRKPVDAVAAEASATLRGIREYEMMDGNPFKAAREALREDPMAELNPLLPGKPVG
jgi:hypothetical protein